MSLYLTVAYRLTVVLALAVNAWFLRSLDRHQYTGPGYQEEQQARQVTQRLEVIEKTLTSIERNTRR